jgi:aspartate carbamoyltransferase catalytic subunit
LLDALTIRSRLGRVEGLSVTIVGDIAQSRVARSALSVLRCLGARVVLVGPPGMLPRSFASLGAELSNDLDAVLPEADVVMSLRIQHERLSGPAIPSLGEFISLYQMNRERLARCKPSVILMHPGPMNRGIEMTADIADGPQSAVREQVSNGVFVRMAVLEWTGGVF